MLLTLMKVNHFEVSPHQEMTRYRLKKIEPFSIDLRHCLVLIVPIGIGSSMIIEKITLFVSTQFYISFHNINHRIYCLSSILLDTTPSSD